MKSREIYTSKDAYLNARTPAKSRNISREQIKH